MTIKDTYTVEELEAMPTIKKGYTEDLKVETETERVWLSNSPDGVGSPGEIYRINHESIVNRCWTVTKEYAPWADNSPNE